MIELKHIWQTYKSPDGKTTLDAVKDVSITINDGEIFGVLGRSGAGKSTLVRCINLLNRPTKGNVIVDGQDLTKLSASELRRVRHKIGMIFQHFNLLSSRTVYDNVALPLELAGVSRDKIREKVTPLLELVGLTEHAKKYPAQLSGGQKQRVGIARALANDPTVLLSDEATSALDPETTTSTLALLRKINKELGVTIVMITHQMEVVKQICERIVVMDHGEVIEEGSVLDVDPCSFGGIGVIAIPEMRRFYRHVLVKNRFPHHGVVAFEKAGKNLYTVLSLLGAKADFNRPKTMLYEGENPFSL